MRVLERRVRRSAWAAGKGSGGVDMLLGVIGWCCLGGGFGVGGGRVEGQAGAVAGMIVKFDLSLYMWLESSREREWDESRWPVVVKRS